MIFHKWQGLGNDFIIVNLDRYPGVDFSGVARKWCDRHFGVGADGVVTVRTLGKHEIEMRIYNSDGSESEMCGNATRCVALYAKQHKMISASEFDLQTRAGVIRPQIMANNAIRVDMGQPRFTRGEIPVAGEPDDLAQQLEIRVADGEKLVGTALSMGNPHLVIFVPEINRIKLTEWGPEIEKSELFPRRINVEFAEIISPRLVRMRVWERGCGVTQACGTGSCATAVAGVLAGKTERHITVLLDGGELQIEYEKRSGRVYMTGPAVEVFRGEIEW